MGDIDNFDICAYLVHRALGNPYIFLKKKLYVFISYNHIKWYRRIHVLFIHPKRNYIVQYHILYKIKIYIKKSI